MISISINRFTTKALVHRDGTWICARGEQKPNGNLVYLYNGRMEISQDGYYRSISERVSDEECQFEVIRLNIQQYTRLTPLRRRR